ncbi:MAG: HAMP domain-containing histidine kinase, partial [Clostridia bacterium]|nr:HAMP domain-containing histidine kinase [Clostridia bacterium]
IAVYFALSRSFAPIEKIRILANEIANGRDLSRRIGLGKEKNELYRLANTFDGMLDKIEQTVQREKRFSSDISHELRTPLSVIRSQCEYANSSELSKGDYEEAMGVIQRQADRMQNLVTQLLTISKIENRGFSEAFEEMNLSELVQFVCDDLEEIDRNGIKLERNVEPDVFVRGNRDLLAVLFINLIKNAYQYSKASGFVFVLLKKEENEVVFSVRDQGVGISEEDLSKIWDRFYRADASRSRTENNNLGLGLSMAVQIAEYHNGKISVQSKLGEGSEFIFKFPFE